MFSPICLTNHFSTNFSQFEQLKRNQTSYWFKTGFYLSLPDEKEIITNIRMVKIAETKFIAYSDNKINNLLKIRHVL